eukprot:Trichotokara_eunicae@DN2151_c0_g1_i1.p1
MLQGGITLSGQPMRFCEKGGVAEVLDYPSRSIILRVDEGDVLFRGELNTRALTRFLPPGSMVASIATPPRKVRARFEKSLLITDTQFRNRMLRKLAARLRSVEGNLEGVELRGVLDVNGDLKWFTAMTQAQAANSQ